MDDRKYIVLNGADVPWILEKRLNEAAMDGYLIFMIHGKNILLTKGGVA